MRRHVWRESKTKSGKVSRWCERCGVDRTPKTVKTGCRPTRLPGL